MDASLYNYRAFIKSVYDGDTCTADIDLGLGCWVHGEKIRLHRINAPEMRGKEKGKVSRDYLREQINKKSIILQTFKDKKGKYGRYLREIWIKNSNNEWINVNDLMVREGFAAYKQY